MEHIPSAGTKAAEQKVFLDQPSNPDQASYRGREYTVLSSQQLRQDPTISGCASIGAQLIEHQETHPPIQKPPLPLVTEESPKQTELHKFLHYIENEYHFYIQEDREQVKKFFTDILPQLHLDDRERFILAKQIAECNPIIAAEYIPQFQLNNENDRIAAARIIATKNANALALYIRQFSITNEEERVKLFTICFTTNNSAKLEDGDRLPALFDRFDIQEEPHRIQCLHLYMQGTSTLYCYNFDKFHISDPTVEEQVIDQFIRYDLQQTDPGLPYIIQQFSHLTSQKRLEIAKKYAEVVPEKTLKSLIRFQIHDLVSIQEVLRAALKANASVVISYLEKQGILDDPEGAPIEFLMIYLECILQDPSVTSHIDINEEQFPESLQKIYKELYDQASETGHQKQWVVWTKTVLPLFISHIPPDQIQHLGEWLKVVSKYHNPQQRIEMVRSMCALCQKGLWNSYVEFIGTQPTKAKHLLAPFLLSLQTSTHPLPPFWTTELSRFSDEGKQAPILIQVLNLLCHDSRFSPVEKMKILSLMVPPSTPPLTTKAKLAQCCSNAAIVSTLLQNETIDKLKEACASDHPKAFSALLNESIGTIFPSLQNSEALQHWSETFGRSRLPNAILLYKGTLSSSVTSNYTQEDKIKCLQALDSFIRSVLTNTFHSSRYQQETSPHLTKVFEGRETLAEAWKEGEKQNIEDGRYAGCTIVDSDDPFDLLLSGEVSGSCQAVDRDPDHSKSLLGTILNGENRLLVLKDQTGKIIGRQIFRLLWEPVQQKPVLFLERFYPRDDVELQREIAPKLLNFAIQRAGRLHLPLLSNFEGTNRIDLPESDRPIVALGGPAPYVYSDAVGQGVDNKDGIYQITRAQIVWTPQS